MHCEICTKVYKKVESLRKHYYYEIRVNPDKKKKILDLINNLKEKKEHKCQYCLDIFEEEKKLTKHINFDCLPTRLETIHTLAKSLIQDCPENDLVSRILNLSDGNQSMKPAPTGIESTTLITHGTITDSNVVNGKNNVLNTINNTVNFSGVRSIDNERIDMYDRPLENTENLLEIFRDQNSHSNVDKMFLTIDKYFNCNKDYPENHNILVTNKKKDVPCLVKVDDEWTSKNGAEMKKIFVNRVMNCQELYSTYIPNRLKELYPQKSESIDRMTDYIVDKYSDENDEIKERLWYQFFLQTYDNREIMMETYKKDLQLIEDQKLLQSQLPLKTQVRMKKKSQIANI